jgi:hypothetical protein
MYVREVDKPIAQCAEGIGWSTDPQWHDLDLVQPCHTLPTNGEEHREAEQEYSACDPGTIDALDGPQVLRNGKEDHAS